MRTLWIGLLTLLARSLQAWSEAVTRRLESVRGSAAGGSAELATPDQPSGEVDGPPADWLERVKSAQAPAHWRAKVSQARSDSIKRIEPSMPDIQNESAPADHPIASQRSEESAVVASPLRSPAQPLPAVRPLSQPNYRAADTTRTEMQTVSDQPLASTHTIDHSPLPVRDRVVTPAKSMATRSLAKSVRPTNTAHSTSNVSAREADLITPEVDATVPVDEVIAARSQPLPSQRERRPAAPTQLIDDARTHQATSEQGIDDQTSPERLVYAERDVRDFDQSQPAPQMARTQSRPAPIPQPAAPVDVMSPIEPRADQVTVTPSPTMLPPHRTDFAVDDRVTASWPAGNTIRSSHAWATIAGQGFADYESSAIENRWPALPPERIEVNENFETVVRESERLRRLDLEQRGLAWSA